MTPLVLTPAQRNTIAEVARDAAHTVELSMPTARGRQKFRVATAIGMRALKAGGLEPALPPADEAPSVAPPEDPLTQAEEALVEDIASTVGSGVGVIAEKIEDQTGCACDQRVLALIRGLLQVGIEVAARAIADEVG